MAVRRDPAPPQAGPAERAGSASPSDETLALELMPRSVRDKLDRVAIKVHLKDWQLMSLAERVRLRDLPCDSTAEVAAYGAEVERLVRRVTGAPPERLRKQT